MMVRKGGRGGGGGVENINTFREVEPVLRKISVCEAEILAFVQKAAIREKKKK